MPDSRSLLVVEDDIDHQALIRRKLVKQPDLFPILEVVSTGEEAMRLSRQFEFDCFLVDHQLRSTTGLELIRDLQTEGHQGPFVLMTSSGSESLVVEAYRRNVHHYLTKDVVFWNELPVLLAEVMEAEASEQASARRSSELLSINQGLDEINTVLQERSQALVITQQKIREKLAVAVEEMEVIIRMLTDASQKKRLRSIRHDLVDIAALSRDQAEGSGSTR